MNNIVYKRIPGQTAKPKLSDITIDFIQYYETAFPDFMTMYGRVADFYCFETDEFHITEINKEYIYFKGKN